MSEAENTQSEGNQGYIAGAAAGISNAASYTYQTVTNVASSTYTQAATYISGGSNDPAEPARSEEVKQEESSTESTEIQRDTHQAAKDRGPSNEDRLGKTQMQIGTEYDIPTFAGPGTTMSADHDVTPAGEKEAADHRAHPAAVGQDYSSLSGSSSKSPEETSSSVATDNTSAADTHDEETAQNEGKHGGGGLGSKIKNKVKGEAKVLVGKIQKDQDKVDQGKALKAGTA